MPDCTIHEAAEAFLGHLREQGKKERTLYTYRKDLEIVEAFFGGDKKMSSIRTPQVGKFRFPDPGGDLAHFPGNGNGTF